MDWSSLVTADGSVDWGAFAFWIGINLLITVIAYLLVPIALALLGKKYELKKLKRISFINSTVVWLIFRIIEISLTDDPSTGAAVFLWGAVGYGILKKHCRAPKQPTPTSSSPSPVPNYSPRVQLSAEDETSPITRTSSEIYGSDIRLEQTTEAPRTVPTSSVSQQGPSYVPNAKPTAKYCSRCGHAIDPTTKRCTGCGKQYFKGFTAKAVSTTILCILLVASLVGNVWFYTTNRALKKEVATLTITNRDLEKDIEQLNDDICDLRTDKNYYYNYWSHNHNMVDFFIDAVVFIEDDGTRLYHKYECNKFVGDSYWAHNVEYAKYLGYSPCSLCFD